VKMARLPQFLAKIVMTDNAEIDQDESHKSPKFQQFHASSKWISSDPTKVTAAIK